MSSSGYDSTAQSIASTNTKGKGRAADDQIHSSKDLRSLKVLSYNVWFREDLEMHKRMKALGDLIQQHSPDLICLQEVTPNIYDIFQQSGWWKLYKCSVSNKMAFTRPYFCMQTLQTRLDRFLCCLRDFRIDGIEMMGMEAIRGLSYCKERKLRREVITNLNYVI